MFINWSKNAILQPKLIISQSKIDQNVSKQPFFVKNYRGQSWFTIRLRFFTKLPVTSNSQQFAFFDEKNCLFILTTIFSVKITIKNYCTEDGYSTERGFCGHSRIRVLNSRKIRAILRYFKIFCQFCRKSTCLLLHNFPLISNLAPFRPKFQFSTEIARWNWVNSKLKSVQFWPNFVFYPEMQNLDIFVRNCHFQSENTIFAMKISHFNTKICSFLTEIDHF